MYLIWGLRLSDSQVLISSGPKQFEEIQLLPRNKEKIYVIMLWGFWVWSLNECNDDVIKKYLEEKSV